MACIKVGDRYSGDYVNRLSSMVSRYLTLPHAFICYTDRPVDGVICRPPLANTEAHPGWWQKVALFRGERPRTLYLDLDVVVVGDLTPLAEWSHPIGIIKDWWQSGFNSSAMLIDAGAAPEIWSRFGPRWRIAMRGDQDWITHCRPDAAPFPAAWCPSWKANRCQAGPPDGAKIVIFHGSPKPHQVGGWVSQAWQ